MIAVAPLDPAILLAIRARRQGLPVEEPPEAPPAVEESPLPPADQLEAVARELRRPWC